MTGNKQSIKNITIKSVGSWADDKHTAHLLKLSERDRYFRFGYAAKDEAVEKYVKSINHQTDKVYGAFNAELEIVGVAHVGLVGKNYELGISILPEYRGQGLGSFLFKRAIDFARMQKAKKLYSYCLGENRSMINMARRENMTVITEFGEAVGSTELPEVTVDVFLEEALSENLALVDLRLKEQVLRLQRGLAFISALSPIQLA